MYEIDKVFSVEILKSLNSMQGSNGVNNVKCSIVGAKDINVKIGVAEETNIKHTLIRLETLMYLSSSKFKIKGIKSINNGLSVLDDKNNTYRIEIITTEID